MVSENSDSRNHPGTLTTNHKPLTNNQGAFVEHQQGGPVGPARADFENRDADSGPGSGPGSALAEVVARGMAAQGVADASASHPKLLALLVAGITPAELVGAATYAASKGRGFAYAMARAEGQRRDSANLASLPDAPPTTDPESRAAIEADGLRLGLGAWQQLDREGRMVPWAEYAAKVRSVRVRQADGVAA